MSDTIYYIILVITGLIAGVINTLAGGGSNLTIPALMLLGMPADVANATNRVGVLMQSVSGIAGFAKHKKLPQDDLTSIVLLTLVAGALGALSASLFTPDILTYILLGSMVTMALVMLVMPGLVLAQQSNHRRLTASPSRWLMLFVAGFYGGLIQAGVGFLLLAAFTGALHYDLARANALKLVATLAFTVIAVIIFIAQDLIIWLPAIALACGSMVGAWLGVKVTLNISGHTMRWLLFVMTLIVSCLVLLKN